MKTCTPAFRAGLGAALLLAAILPVCAPVDAAEPTCPTEAPPAKKKSSGFGGLLSAAKRAGVGRVLGAGALGDGQAAQVAGAVAGTAGGRTGEIAGVAAGTAVELARQSRADCSRTAANGEPPAEAPREWHATN